MFNLLHQSADAARAQSTMPPRAHASPKAVPGCLVGQEVREDAIPLVPKGQAGAAHIPAPCLQGAIRELLGAGLGVCQEDRLTPV